MSRRLNYADPNYIGGTEDIAVSICDYTLDDAKKLLNNLPVKYQPHSVLMFRGIVEPISIDYSAYLKKENIHCERLRVKAEGIFFNEFIPLTESDREKYFEQIITHDEYNHDDNNEFHAGHADWKIAYDAVSNLLQNHMKGTYLYSRDLEEAPAETTCLLQDFQSHISANESKDIPEMADINISMHYVGEKGSYTAHHEEDGGLSSINLLKSGKPKVWFVIDRRFRSELEEQVFHYLSEKCPKEQICSQVLKHKIYFLSLALLDKWKIPYQLLVQYPGDMFFIKRGTYHAVINKGRNAAEAINYGCDEWNGSYEPASCDCDESHKHDVAQDRTIVTVQKRTSKPLYKCGINECQNLFQTLDKLRIHKAKKHSIEHLHVCPICSKSFSHRSGLCRHKKIHSKEGTRSVECNLCHVKVNDLQRHKSRVHGEKKKCSKCGKLLNTSALKKHEKTCSLQCLLCTRIFSNQRYLTQHMNACNKLHK